MGIGPSTKETSLHHFRDPLLDVVSSDEDLDLMGIIIVGTPDDNTDKLLVGTRAAVWAEAMRADAGMGKDKGIINLNTATKAELLSLSGIGESRAEAIIAYRETNGGFRKIEDLKKVDGIKEGIFQKIREQITVE